MPLRIGKTRLRACIGTLFALILIVALVPGPVAARELLGDPDSSNPPSASPPRTMWGWHVPWAAGGARIEPDGARVDHPGEWPDFEVDALRLWDTRTAWLNIEPRVGVFDFSHLDRQLAIAREHHVERITLVLWGTPAWAASEVNPTDAPWLGPGSASMPVDIEDWRTYVHAVATRYRGQIDSYEIGNEPNHSWFWRGNDAQLVKLVREAALIIRQVDPDALVVAPAPLVVRPLTRSSTDVDYWSLLAGGGEGAPPVDALSFHWYPASGNPADLQQVVEQLRAAANGAGLSGIPIWVTEVNYPAWAQPCRVIPETEAMMDSLGIERAYWYAWSSLPSERFMNFGRGTKAEACANSDKSLNIS